MPLYEYQCQKCGERVEAIQKLADPPSTICPHCGGDLKKLFSAPAIQFKGSGFYITDYARGGKTSGKEEGESTKKKETEKTSGSKDSGSGGSSSGSSTSS